MVANIKVKTSRLEIKKNSIKKESVKIHCQITVLITWSYLQCSVVIKERIFVCNKCVIIMIHC